MKETIYVGTNIMLSVLRKMFVRGEITEEQLLECYRRNDKLHKEERFNLLVVR